MMRSLAAAALTATLSAAAPAPTKPLLDPKPATIGGVAYGPERVFEGDYTNVMDANDFDPLGPKGPKMWLQGWSGDVGDFHIRFIGRRTVKPGRYGERHLRHAVMITDLVDARPKSLP